MYLLLFKLKLIICISLMKHFINEIHIIRIYKKNIYVYYNRLKINLGGKYIMAFIPMLNNNSGGSGAKVFTGVISTTWTEDENTGVKTQFVAIEGVTAKHTGKADNINTHERTTDGYAAYVEETNQFLEFITNGDAETVDGGAMFYIYGDANTVEIPFILEVV